MQYLLMIYVNEQQFDAQSPEVLAQSYTEYMAIRADLEAKHQLVGGARLAPIASATTVRVRDGKPTMTDGPFAETREQLGGYFLVEAKDLDEATAIAARLPGARLGCVEVRPLARMT